MIIYYQLIINTNCIARLVQEDAEVRGSTGDEAHLHTHKQAEGEGRGVRNKVQL